MRRNWIELEEFPSYSINQYGEIVNPKNEVFRRYSVAQNGMQKVTLYDTDGRLKTRSVAVLVAKTFCEPLTPHCNTVIHLDGDFTNCRADNLTWRPRWYAVKFHRQFHYDVFHTGYAHLEDIEEIGSGRQYRSIKEVCMVEGLYCVDVYKSLVEEIPVPVTGQEFSYF